MNWVFRRQLLDGLGESRLKMDIEKEYNVDMSHLLAGTKCQFTVNLSLTVLRVNRSPMWIDWVIFFFFFLRH